MTLYRIYGDNGDRAGCWVQHRKWTDRCAQIQSIAGKRDGRLPGAAPHHDDAPVELRWFDVRSGRELVALPQLENHRDKSYTTIAEPWWSRRPVRHAAPTAVSSGGSRAF